MGQTLTHGVYLPDEGERNCYAGLAANWQILDTSVGTIAANTAALAGKANAVHTHTKADITDLFNSNFIPSANNSYDLGSSAYQWNNLYAKNYYYNGTAWGLDKANVWTKTQNFVGECQGTELSNNYNTCFGMYGVRDTVGKSGMFFTKYRPNKTQGNLVSSDIIQYGVDVLENEIRTNNVFDLQVRNYDSNTGGFTRIDVISLLSNANLGTSTNKWKTLNGINPGALSLPDYNRFEPIDFSQYDVNLGWNNLYTPSEDGWLYAEIDDTATNSIYIYSSGLQPVQSVNRKYGVSAQGNGSQSGYGGRLAVMIPVRKDIQYRFLIKASAVSDIYAVIFYHCLGNV